MPYSSISLWKKNAIRKTTNPIHGRHYYSMVFSVTRGCMAANFFSVHYFIFFILFSSFFYPYKLATWNGLTILFIFTACGAMLVWYNDIVTGTTGLKNLIPAALHLL
ncbi:MAG: hypothetical protein WDO19_11055 [Bacteroidota bacterium]